MNYILAVILAVFVVACSKQEKFDSTNKKTINDSSHAIANSLPKEKRAEFGRALIYFSTSDKAAIRELRIINGLTGEEIIQKYKRIRKKDELKLKNQAKADKK